MALFPSDATLLGIAKEAVFGTAVAPTAFIPADKFDFKRVITQLEDKGRRGSAVEDYGQTQGVWHGEASVNGDVRPDTFGWHLAAILGDIVTAGGGAPFTHTMSLLNSGSMQPKSYTLTHDYAVAQRAFPGMRCSDLTLKFNADGKLTYDAKWTGRAEAIAADPVQSFSAVELMPGWRCVPTIGGVSVNLLDAEVALKRPIDAVNVANNSQDAVEVFLGSLGVTGHVTLIMEADTYYTSYLNNTQDALVLDFQMGAGAALVQTKLQMSKLARREGNIDTGGSYVKIGLPFKALGNVTDAGASGGHSPLKATTQSALPANTYA